MNAETMNHSLTADQAEYMALTAPVDEEEWFPEMCEVCGEPFLWSTRHDRCDEYIRQRNDEADVLRAKHRAELLAELADEAESLSKDGRYTGFTYMALWLRSHAEATSPDSDEEVSL